MFSRSLRHAASGSAQMADRERAKRLSWEANRPSRLATGDGTPGNPDYQSGIRGQTLPTVMCRPVEPRTSRGVRVVRRRLIGVISLLFNNEVIPMFDPITRAPASWVPTHEHGRRGQTLSDSRCLSCRNHQGRSGSKRVRRMPIWQTANPVQGVRATVHCTMLVQPRLAWGASDTATCGTAIVIGRGGVREIDFGE